MSDLVNSVLKALDQANASSNIFTQQVSELKTPAATDVQETGVNEKDLEEAKKKKMEAC
jgi:hypothetical protein